MTLSLFCEIFMNRYSPALFLLANIILFSFLWVGYFYGFHDTRLEKSMLVSSQNDIAFVLPLFLKSIYRYGLWVPALCMHSHYDCLRFVGRSQFLISVVLLIAIYTAFTIFFELFFEGRPIALWQFYIVSVPICSMFGLVSGWGKSLITRNGF